MEPYPCSNVSTTAGPALVHLRHCAMQTPLSPVSLPLISYKGNIAMLQVEGMSGIQGASPLSLDRFTWLAASVAPLSSFLGGNSTYRGMRSRLVHMNVGAGVHLSSVWDPVEVWYKSISVQHGMENLEMRHRMPPWFIRAGRDEKITAAAIRKVTGTASPCRSTNPQLIPAWEALQPKEFQFLIDALPWALRHNPNRYPFMTPKCSGSKKQRTP